MSAPIAYNRMLLLREFIRSSIIMEAPLSDDDKEEEKDDDEPKDDEEEENDEESDDPPSEEDEGENEEKNDNVDLNVLDGSVDAQIDEKLSEFDAEFDEADQFDAKVFAMRVSKLMSNAKKVFDIDGVIAKRAEEYVAQNYDVSIAEEFATMLESLIDDGDDLEYDIPAPFATGAGPSP